MDKKTKKKLKSVSAFLVFTGVGLFMVNYSWQSGNPEFKVNSIFLLMALTVIMNIYDAFKARKQLTFPLYVVLFVTLTVLAILLYIYLSTEYRYGLLIINITFVVMMLSRNMHLELILDK